MRAWPGLAEAESVERHIAPSVVRPRFVRRTTVQSYHEQTTYTNLWDRRSKSARTPLLETGRTGEESATDGLADYLEERSQG